MLLHIGADNALYLCDVIAITAFSKDSMPTHKNVVWLDEDPKSCVYAKSGGEYCVYLSPLSASALHGRSISGAQPT